MRPQETLFLVYITGINYGKESTYLKKIRERQGKICEKDLCVINGGLGELHWYY